MPCKNISEMLASYAAGALTQEEYAMVDQHLNAPCEACQLELAGQMSAAAILAEVVAPVVPPSSLKNALMSKIENPIIEDETTTEEAPQVISLIQAEASKASQRDSYLAYAATALIALTVGSLASIGLDSLGRDQAQVAKEIPADRAIEEDYEEWGRQIDKTRRALRISGARLVNVSTSTDNPDFVSHLIYDELSGQLHLMIAGTPASSESESSVWVWAKGTEGKILSSGPVLPISQLYSASLIDLPNGPSKVSELVITQESVVEPTNPSGEQIGSIKLELE